MYKLIGIVMLALFFSIIGILMYRDVGWSGILTIIKWVSLCCIGAAFFITSVLLIIK